MIEGETKIKNGDRAMKVILFFLLILMLLIYSECSLNKMAMNAMADALATGNGNAYTSDNDPQFVAEALPFGLKTMEVILESTPEHTGLLTATAAGFVQYGHAFILYPAQELEYSNYTLWLDEKKRAKQFFLRARNYGLRALATNHFAVDIHLKENPVQAVQQMEKTDVPALYWTGAAWASALSTDKSDMSLVADLPIIKALMERALDLDAEWDSGAVHEFFIVFAASQPEVYYSVTPDLFRISDNRISRCCNKFSMAKICHPRPVPSSYSC